MGQPGHLQHKVLLGVQMFVIAPVPKAFAQTSLLKIRLFASTAPKGVPYGAAENNVCREDAVSCSKATASG